MKKAKWSEDHSKQVDGNVALVKLIAGKMLPLSLVDCDLLKEFLSIVAPHYSLPGKDRLVLTLIPQHVQKIENTIRAMICETAVSMTVDIWTTRQNRSFLGITG